MPLLRLFRESFTARLLLGVALTLIAAGGASYALVGDRLRDNVLEEGLEEQYAMVDQFQQRVDAGGVSAHPLHELRAFATEVSRVPDVVSVMVVDGRGTVIASRGRQERVRHRRDGALYARGAKARAQYRAARGGHFEYIVPLHLRRLSYALVVDRDRSRLDLQLATVRESLLAVGLPAAVLALALFWLLSGRSLHQRHRFALERATRDGLTDLGNHRAFQDELRRAVALAERSGSEFGLVLFDVDDFKFLNDRYGHQTGDDMLRRVAGVLHAGRAQDRAFRTGGDEFAVLMAATGERDSLRGATRLRRLMLDAGVTVSAGVSASRPGMRDPEVLREEADAALYDAKRRHAECPVAFSDISERAEILTPEKSQSVRAMLAQGVLDVALQPIWNIAAGTLIGFEALARPLPEYGLAGPAEAFDVAAQLGRVQDLDRLCITRILERAPELPPDAYLFVNLSPSTLEDDVIDVAWLRGAVARAGMAPGRVVIEITERAGARVPAVVRGVTRLRDAGFRVALDDVGAGNSGLEMLRSITVDYVKVDRAVVSAAMSDPSARAVLSAVAAFAGETGAFVIAEGIENDEVLAFIRGHEVGASSIAGGQGYGLGRPGRTVAEALRGAMQPV